MKKVAVDSPTGSRSISYAGFDPVGRERSRTETKTDAANDAAAEPGDPELMDVNPERADQQAAGPAARRHDARLARAGALHPTTPDGSREPEEYEEQCESPAQHGNLPVAGGGENLLEHPKILGAGDAGGEADRPGQGQPEHREAIGHPDAKMNGQGSRWHEPAVEAWPGDDTFLA